jgi:Flp pilus assembly protein TadD
MRAAAVLLVAWALGGAPFPTHADPGETNPDLATRDEDYAAAKKAIDSKQWEAAIARLQKAEKRNPDHADLQNYLGYAHRNLKQFDAAFRHYKRAIELDPRHRGAHEYIGEAYLMVGDVPNAEKHLAALRAICLLPCEELADLEKAFKTYRR